MKNNETTCCTGDVLRRSIHGWTWRGGVLEDGEIAAYTDGVRTKHLGVAHTRLGQVYDFPVLFRVYAQRAWIAFDDPHQVVFPPNSEFWVRDTVTLSDGRISICMEQAVPEMTPYVRARVEFRAWVATLTDLLPQAPLELVLAWFSPFARWGLKAEEGDEPMVGVVYDHEDSIHYVGNFTGLDEGVVRRVIDAMERYLKLVGLIPAPLDAALLKEREAMKDLLPGNPKLINASQELAYLQLVTGLKEETIALVRAAESAYCLHIGVLDLPT